MDTVRKVAEEQHELWNGSSGRAWVDVQAVTDVMFAPLAERLAEAARPGERVLDIGCGAGATTRALAAAVEPGGRATGVDISAPLIEAAQAHDTTAEFVLADAGTHPFDPGRYDLLTSRFGVMFFADPTAAFANLRRATRDGGRLCAITWRSVEENPFMGTAGRAARPLLPDLPTPPADGPGQFAFADADRVEAILTDAGWSTVAHEPLDAELTMPAAGLETYLTRLGPLSRVLPELEPARRDEVMATVRAAFDPYMDGDAARFTAACWVLQATA
jgi:SAM-dependent methyltransferase